MFICLNENYINLISQFFFKQLFSDFVKWYLVFKTEQWDESISAPGAVSGSNIVARYVSQSNKDGTKKVDTQLKRKKMEKYHYVRSLERSYGLTQEEETACKSSSMVEFLHILYKPVNADLTLEKSKLDTESYISYHLQSFKKKLSKWNNYQISDFK